MKNYNRYEHESWVMSLWVGFFVMWFIVAFGGLFFGIIGGLVAAFK